MVILKDDNQMRKILIVDDQPEIRELIRLTLELGNFRIFSASNGQQALAIAQSVKPDIVLLDVRMPDSSISGLEVCRQLKSDPTVAKSYIIIISASGEEQNLALAKAAGADDFLIKPFSPIALIDKVEEVVREYL